MTDSNFTAEQKKKNDKSSNLTVALVVVWIVAGILLLTPKGEKKESTDKPTQSVPATVPETVSPRPETTPDGSTDPSVGQEQQQEEQRKAGEAQKQREQDIYDTKLEIDRHQKAIQQCEANIVTIDAQLANPYLAATERQKLQDLRSFRQQKMDEEASMLVAAQQKLRHLQGSGT